jgi:hypothetical protein
MDISLHNNASLDSVDDYTEFRADQSSNKERLDVFLTRHIPALSRAKVQKVALLSMESLLVKKRALVMAISFYFCQRH